MKMKTCLVRLAAGLLLAAGFLSQAAHAASHAIPGQYIVVFKDHVSDASAESDRKLRQLGGRKIHGFSRALKGFSGHLSDAAVQQLRNDPDVEMVEQDQTVEASTTYENSATWGISRIDQADRPIDTLYGYNYDGTGVYAFVIDTGILANHVELAGRVLTGKNFANNANNLVDPNNTTDCNGHGTHVSGTIGGTLYGVAKNVQLIPVRVLDCKGSGTTSGVIAGLDYVAGSALRPAVANMSLGGGLSSTLNAAVKNVFDHGVTVVVAAGNDNVDACKQSPSSEPTAITVGATTSSDARASFSNYGKCVDLFAPGVNITSAWGTGSAALNTISGTSMATPHVAGVAALALQANPSASPTAVTNFIKANASANKLSSLGTGSPNLLVYSLAGGAPSEPTMDTIAVKSLSGSSAKAGGTSWKANVTAAIRDLNTGLVVPNARMTGSFAPGGSASCTTGSTGQCTMSSTSLSGGTSQTVFTIGTVSATNMIYDASQNSASSITIRKR